MAQYKNNVNSNMATAATYCFAQKLKRSIQV